MTGGKTRIEERAIQCILDIYVLREGFMSQVLNIGDDAINEHKVSEDRIGNRHFRCPSIHQDKRFRFHHIPKISYFAILALKKSAKRGKNLELNTEICKVGIEA